MYVLMGKKDLDLVIGRAPFLTVMNAAVSELGLVSGGVFVAGLGEAVGAGLGAAVEAELGAATTVA